VVSVFLVAESEAQLVARLVARKTEPLDKMMTRVQTARWGLLGTREGLRGFRADLS
jgi:guanylate kinase